MGVKSLVQGLNAAATAGFVFDFVLSYLKTIPIARNFRQEFNCVAFVKAIFWLNLIPDYFSQTRSVGSETFMNVKINGKQKSDERTTGEQMFDENIFLTDCLMLADENFLLYSLKV